MTPFTKMTGQAVTIPNNDIDTDILMPKQFLKNILKTGFGRTLFYIWRYNDDGTPNPDFILNRPEYAGVTILITGNNFGAGSSREHAVWAMTDYGFRVVIAGSFSDIFYMNATKNGLLPIVMPEEERAILRTATPDARVTVDLEQQIVVFGDHTFNFDINPQWRHKFLTGEDDIAVTMRYESDITAFEKERPDFDN